MLVLQQECTLTVGSLLTAVFFFFFALFVTLQALTHYKIGFSVYGICLKHILAPKH